MTTAPNRNIFWAKTFVDELARCGLEAVCIAPGSRSTPLVIAFAENPHIKVYSHIDERSAAFFALGLALATDKPVAILCSSGTATANFHPAVIEARYANVPLLVLTADRSHELRDSGANQTIDQVKMFGTHILWAYDAALPEANPPAVAIRNLRTLADRAYARANGVMGIEKGPVHINFPFRKPLEPTPVEEDVTDIEPYPEERPFTSISRGRLLPDPHQIRTLGMAIQNSKRGLIICGPRSGVSRAQELALLTGFPLFADPLSNYRSMQDPDITPLGGYDTFLSLDGLFEDPDLIIHLGAMPASAALESYLNKVTTQRRILITETGVWTDAYHRITDVIHAEPEAVFFALKDEITEQTVDREWAEKLRKIETANWEALESSLAEELFDGSAIATVIDTLSNIHYQGPIEIGTHLFVASSLPVRHVEQFFNPKSMIYGVYANRGASGIDGTISSALGVAASDPTRPTVLITGDLAFYHDLNGLLAVKRCGIKNITIVLINNDGGGIFQRLPIRDFDPPFTDLFLTPHGLDFEPAVRMYGLAYQRAETLPDLREKVKNAVGSDVPTVIEVRTDSKRDLERRNEINKLVQDRLRELFKS